MSLSTALIGHTGFVGGNIARQHVFDDNYDASNIESIQGKAYGLVACAGAPGVKWKANKEPVEDKATIDRLIANLRTITAETFVLISTIDVYAPAVDVTESTPIDERALEPYGRHRRELEMFVEQHFPNHLVVHLPALFGPGLKKNVLFDFLTGTFDKANPASTLQFYNLEYLWKDITCALEHHLPVLNIATEPMTIAELAREVFDKDLAPIDAPAVHYDMKSEHHSLWGQPGPYLYSKDSELTDIKHFAKHFHV